MSGRERVVKVTRQRMKTRAYYRLQVNADKPTVAFGYNLMGVTYDEAQMSVVRNLAARVCTRAVQDHLRVLLRRPGIDRTLHEFLREHVDPECHADCIAFWKSQGWKPNGDSGTLF